MRSWNDQVKSITSLIAQVYNSCGDDGEYVLKDYVNDKIGEFKDNLDELEKTFLLLAAKAQFMNMERNEHGQHTKSFALQVREEEDAIYI